MLGASGRKFVESAVEKRVTNLFIPRVVRSLASRPHDIGFSKTRTNVRPFIPIPLIENYPIIYNSRKRRENMNKMVSAGIGVFTVLSVTNAYAEERKKENSGRFDSLLSKIAARDPRIKIINFDKQGITELTDSELKNLEEAVNKNDIIGNIEWGSVGLPWSQKSIKSRIKKKLELNNFLFRYYPSDYTMGLLSLHVYQGEALGVKSGDKVILESELEKTDLLKDWFIHKVYKNKECGYYAISYINPRMGQIVLAHRGTVPGIWDFAKRGSSVAADVREVLKGQWGEHQEESLTVVEDLVNHEVKQLGYNLSFTGHSLGGWLAEISTYHCAFKLGCPQVHTVVFDSPGAYRTMKGYKSSVISKETKVDQTNLDIVSYLSRPNLVNISDKHVGKVYAVFPDIESIPFISLVNNTVESIERIIKPNSTAARIDYFIKRKIPLISEFVGAFVETIPAARDHLLMLETISGHSLEKIIATFDPKTGKPYKCVEVLDWPRILFKDLQGSSSNSILVDEIIPLVLEYHAGRIDLTAFNSALNYLDRSDGFKDKEGLSVKDKVRRLYESHLDFREANFGKAALKDTALDKYLLQVYLDASQVISSQSPFSATRNLLTELLSMYMIEGNTIKSFGETVDVIRQKVRRVVEIDENTKNLELSGKSKLSMPTMCSYLPVGRNTKSFVGREKEAKKITHSLDGQKVVVISGYPGVGKTSLAVECAYRFRENTKSKQVWWFSEGKVDEGYREIAKTLNSSLEQHQQINLLAEPKLLMRSVHARLEKMNDILFVFDNIDDSVMFMNNLLPYINELPDNVSLIITSRDRNLCQSAAFDISDVHLQPFTKKEAAEYASTMLKKEHKKQISNLVELFESEGYILPRRLNYAVVNLQKNNLKTIDKYILEYNKLLGEGRPAPETDIVFGELLTGKGAVSSEAWRIVQYCALLDPDFVPLKLINALISGKKVGWWSYLTSSHTMLEGESLQKSVNILQSLSLVDVISDINGNKGLRIHRELPKEVKMFSSVHKKDSIDRNILCKDIILQLDDLFQAIDWSTYENWDKAVLFAKSSIEFCRVAELNEKWPTKERRLLANLYWKQGIYYREVLRDFDKALDCFEKTLELRKNVFSYQDSEDLALAYNKLGNTYDDFEMYDKCLEPRLKALEIQERLYSSNPKKHEWLYAWFLNNVGHAFMRMGSYEESLDYFMRAYRIRLSIYGGTFDKPNDDKEIALSLNNIGCAKAHMGCFQEAKKLQEDALEMRRRMFFGKDHDAVAVSLLSLASTYDKLDLVVKSRKLREEALSIRKRLYSKKDRDPRLADVLYDFGEYYFKDGNYRESKINFEEALDLYKEAFPQGHKVMFRTLKYLIKSSIELGHLKDIDRYKFELEKMEVILKNRELKVISRPDVTDLSDYQKSSERKVSWVSQEVSRRQDASDNRQQSRG